MSLSVATPDRRHATAPGVIDAPRLAPTPRGGQNGPVASPSRTAAAEGHGVLEGPSLAPQRGGAKGWIDEVFRRVCPFSWAAGGSNGGLPNATPRAYEATRYVRQYANNVTPLRTFDTFGDPRTVWTTNRVQSDGPAGGAMSEVPYDRRRVSETFGPTFDTRLQADYLPREAIQLSSHMRRVLKDAQGKQRAGRFDRLTRLAPQRSFGQSTMVLTPQPLEQSPGVAESPHAAVAPPSGRFGTTAPVERLAGRYLGSNGF